jgi:hypothetical protein
MASDDSRRRPVTSCVRDLDRRVIYPDRRVRDLDHRVIYPGRRVIYPDRHFLLLYLMTS